VLQLLHANHARVASSPYNNKSAHTAQDSASNVLTFYPKAIAQPRITLHSPEVEAVHGVQALVHADLLTQLPIIVPWLYNIDSALRNSCNPSALVITVLTSTRFVSGSPLPLLHTIVKQLISHQYPPSLRLNVLP